MEESKFKKNNETFSCIHCGGTVPQHPTSSRDHCNNCLFGLHVDVNPGDRLNQCKGVLEPVGLKIANGKKQIVYTCQKCEKRVFCIVAPDDNKEEIIKLSSKVYS